MATTNHVFPFSQLQTALASWNAEGWQAATQPRHLVKTCLEAHLVFCCAIKVNGHQVKWSLFCTLQLMTNVPSMVNCCCPPVRGPLLTILCPCGNVISCKQSGPRFLQSLQLITVTSITYLVSHCPHSDVSKPIALAIWPLTSTHASLKGVRQHLKQNPDSGCAGHL